jgi:RimJ/RimL family protein N-acetyltransferase
VLVVATVELVESETAGRLAAALDVALAPDWPPEFHGPEQLAFTREALARPGEDGWWLHYVVDDGTLAGVCGFKGPPVEGTVEVGYSIVASRQRRGLATAAVGELCDRAWARGAERVTAHTLPHLEPSIGVLRKLGFEEAEPPEEGVLAFALQRPRAP